MVLYTNLKHCVPTEPHERSSLDRQSKLSTRYFGGKPGPKKLRSCGECVDDLKLRDAVCASLIIKVAVPPIQYRLKRTACSLVEMALIYEHTYIYQQEQLLSNRVERAKNEQRMYAALLRPSLLGVGDDYVCRFGIIR